MADNARPHGAARRAERARRRRRRIAAVAAGVAVVGGGSAAIAATTGSGSSLQLATVALGTVTQTVESSGTVTASTKETAQFPVSGTVKSIAVAVGDKVSAGQALAHLDTTALQTTVDSVAASLAAAQQKLSSDASGQLSVGTSGSGTGTATLSAVLISAPAGATATAPTNASTKAATPSGSTTTVTKAQAAVIAAQKQVDAGQTQLDAAQRTVDADINQNTKLRDAQVAACATTASTSTSTSASPSASTTDPSAPAAADCTTASANYAASADTLATDTATVDNILAAQDGYLHTLAAAISALDHAITQLSSSAGGSGSNGSSSSRASGASTGSGSGSAGGSGSSSGATSQPASAAQLAADQASIDALTAQLAESKQNLAAATLTSPSAGIVAAVGFTPGASSSGASITIVGTGVEGVQTSVPLGQIDSVKVGQPVTVAADGRTTPLHGTVASIGLLSTTSGSKTTFPVTVRLDSASPTIYDGTGADVVISTGSAANVTTVPTSAIHTGPNHTFTVSVANGSKQSTVRVTIGLAGTDLTQITSGLKVGQKVVLSDLSQTLPSSANTVPTVGRFGGGGFAGGGR